MAKYTRHVWHQTRGSLLALLGVAAAYGLSLPLKDAGYGFGWQAGLGFAAFLATVLAIGRYVFRMHAGDAVEEAATAIRYFGLGAGRAALLTLVFLAALISHHNHYA